MDFYSNEALSNQRWLLDNGFIHDVHKDNLYIYGSLLHVGIKHVELTVEPKTKQVSYKLYCSNKLEKKIKLFNNLKDKQSIFHLWRLKRLLKKEGNLDFLSVLSHMVMAYCGPSWNVSLSIKNEKEYIDEPYNEQNIDFTQFNT